MRIFFAGLVGAITLGGVTVGVLTPAQAQNAGAMTCDQLWYERNRLYSEAGYCFKTPRAVSTFGEGCFPPYGKLSGWKRERADELQMWERRRGC